MRSAKGAGWASRTTYLSPGVRNCGWTLRSSAGRPRMSGAWAARTLHLEEDLSFFPLHILAYIYITLYICYYNNVQQTSNYL